MCNALYYSYGTVTRAFFFDVQLEGLFDGLTDKNWAMGAHTLKCHFAHTGHDIQHVSPQSADLSVLPIDVVFDVQLEGLFDGLTDKNWAMGAHTLKCHFAHT